MKSIKNNYPIGINSYLFKNKEDATAYSGVQGGKLAGTNQKLYEERIAKEKYGYWAPKESGFAMLPVFLVYKF